MAGYYGQQGSSNAACVSPQQLQAALNSPSTSHLLKCKSDASCNIWESCSPSTSLCVMKSKSCDDPLCSAHGSCEFVNANDHSKVPFCNFADVRCSAVCACDEGFYGSACAMDDAQLAATQSTRELLLDSLSALVSPTSADSPSTVKTWIGAKPPDA